MNNNKLITFNFNFPILQIAIHLWAQRKIIPYIYTTLKRRIVCLLIPLETWSMIYLLFTHTMCNRPPRKDTVFLFYYIFPGILIKL